MRPAADIVLENCLKIYRHFRIAHLTGHSVVVVVIVEMLKPEHRRAIISLLLNEGINERSLNRA